MKEGLTLETGRGVQRVGWFVAGKILEVSLDLEST